MFNKVALDGNPIRFYERGQPYFEFTNFAEYPIQLDGKTWPTSEHYFQAQKFVGTPYEEQVRNVPRARDAFDLSRRPEVSQWLRSDWEKVKLDVMYQTLLAKFSQHSNLKDMLVKTGKRQLIEHTSRDSYWGDGGDGRGQNHLGQLLMKVRSELCNSSSLHEDKGWPNRHVYLHAYGGDGKDVTWPLEACIVLATNVLVFWVNCCMYIIKLLTKYETDDVEL